MRSRIKKILEIIILLGFTFVIILYAKNYKQDKEKELEAIGNEEQTEKVFDVWYTYTGYEPFLKEAALRYEEENGIKVRLTYYTTINYADKIRSASSEGKGPDLFIVPSDGIQNVVLLGIAEQNYYTDLYNEENYSAKSIDETTYVGKQYGYPMGFETTVFAANRTYIDEMPKTFDDIKIFADNFNNSGEEAEDAHDYSNVSSILKWDISDFLYNYGFMGKYLNVAGKYGDNPSIIDVNNENAVLAGQYYFSLSQYFFTEAASSKYSNVMNEFFEGKIIYTIASSDIIKRMSESELPIDISVLPNLTNDLESASVSKTDILMVNPFADMKEEAREFAKFVTFDMAQEMYDLCNIISTKNIVYDNENLNIFLKAYEKSATLPKLMTTSDYWLKVNNVLSNIWKGEDVSNQLNTLHDVFNNQIN